MRSQITTTTGNNNLSLMQWEQKPQETAEEYAAFLEFANHEDARMTPAVFCEKCGYPELVAASVRFSWAHRKSAMIEYQGLVTGLRAKQTVYRLLNDTVSRIEKIEADVYEAVDRAGALSEEGAAALQVFFRCAEMASRLTNAINDKSMRVNVITQINAQIPSLSSEWDNPSDAVIDGDG